MIIVITSIIMSVTNLLTQLARSVFIPLFKINFLKDKKVDYQNPYQKFEKKIG